MPVNMNGKGMVVGMNKGILFDVDGTLWDSAAQVAESWNEVLARYPHLGVRITAQDMYDNMGKTMMDIGKTLFPGLAQEECRKVMEECMTYENHYLLTHPGVLYPEAGEIMARLSRQYGLYIVSNCQSGYIEVLLKSCSLREYVRDIECYGNTGLPKGDNIRMVVRRNHLERCFYVGDTHMDEERPVWRDSLCTRIIWLWQGREAGRHHRVIKQAPRPCKETSGLGAGHESGRM